MTNKLVIINSFEVPKTKKILPHEMKFLVPNYSCTQNPWLGGYSPQIPVLSVLNWICWTPPSSRTKFLDTPLLGEDTFLFENWSNFLYFVKKLFQIHRVRSVGTELICPWICTSEGTPHKEAGKEEFVLWIWRSNQTNQLNALKTLFSVHE